MTDTKTPIELSKKVSLYRILTGTIPVVLLLFGTIATQMTSTKIKARKLISEDVVIKTQTYEEAVSFNNFLNAQKINLEKMNIALPSESMVVGVVQDVELLVRAIDPKAKVQFSASTPARIGQDLVVPMSITLNAKLSELPSLLDQLLKLPYLIQIVSTESQIATENTSTIITLRLYVQEPFAGY